MGGTAGVERCARAELKDGGIIVVGTQRGAAQRWVGRPARVVTSRTWRACTGGRVGRRWRAAGDGRDVRRKVALVGGRRREEREGVLARAVPCGSEGGACGGRARRQAWGGAGGSDRERRRRGGEPAAAQQRAKKGRERKREKKRKGKRRKEKGKRKERKWKEKKERESATVAGWSGTCSCQPCSGRHDVRIKEKVLVGFGARKWELDRLKRVF
ncbi:hypothetical protein GQ55_7G011700 [Panicum hallii var. hallii]|uniref:Uncharacterized protein n=1 Tax=Panicum hallii var. hallii TaxID=1504633 RepID=A0A2T7CRP9_9POAL|nr:hypothetical protein GQ55_7G011700 [Panicum hallii var. hallii]